ncbi:Hypothetical protein D9617_1g086360 [Elsinoe fawcettii]|nr:Hypothetical protein D9617_1g086360 [Elsinoe fawcettii]
MLVLLLTVLSVSGVQAVPSNAGTFVQNCINHLVEERADPIVNPGKAATHVHTIGGGNGFALSMDFQQARRSTCSSCEAISEDLSNYWSPKLYFQAQNGSILSIPIGGQLSSGEGGGMAIYYNPRHAPGEDIKAFPDGFRMMAGDTNRRKYNSSISGRAISYLCDSTTYYSLPTQTCKGNIRLQINFPSCWNGRDIDTSDHKSHMAYPLDNLNNGPCPPTHPVRLPSLFHEIVYQTSQPQYKWYSNKQPFVLSNGDMSGYGYHGDFVNGWDKTKLQRALDLCKSGESCTQKYFTSFKNDVAWKCRQQQHVKEQVNGVLDKLPGGPKIGGIAGGEKAPSPPNNALGDLVSHNPATAPSYDTVLTGRFVTLRAVSPSHADDLYPRISGPTAGPLFDYLFDVPYISASDLRSALEKKRATTNPWTYTIFKHSPSPSSSPDGKEAVGFLSLMRMDLPNRVIEVGSILFSPDLQRTAAATEAIYLLARHVFDDLGFRRFEWKCNDLNKPSMRAAERLGFKYEGTFRKHMILKGRSRDTAWFAMVDEDWEGLRRGFETWLGEGNFDAEGKQRRRLEECRAGST